MLYFVGLIDVMEGYGIQLRSHHIDSVPGDKVNTSIIRMMSNSSKLLLFLDSDYLDSNLSNLELDFVRVREEQEIVVVTADINLSSLLDKLPATVSSILLENKHLVYPAGICSSQEANHNAFIQRLAEKLKPSNTSSEESSASTIQESDL